MKKEKSYTSNKLNILALKAKICGLQDLSKAIHSSLQSKSGIERMLEREVKRNLSSTIRSHLIAYALMRGKPYSSTERKCKESNKPNAQEILNIIQSSSIVYSFELRNLNFEKIQKELER